MTSDIKVSVCVVTYNQEQYIAQCLQSLVDQKTNFKFEIIVGDDCSTDNTQLIIKEFENKYPEIIKPIYRVKNIGGGENYIQTHAVATGEYIAHMDGDDYSLPGKLQIQADFLDMNKECNIVWTPVLLEVEKGRCVEQNERFRKIAFNKKYNRAELIKFGTIGINSSKMYRKIVREFRLPNFDVMDYFINIEQVNKGVACFSGTIPLTVYRAGIGVASSGVKTRKILLQSIKFFAEKYPKYRLEANVAASIVLLSDIKNLRKTLPTSFYTYIKTFKIRSIVVLIKEIKFIKTINIR